MTNCNCEFCAPCACGHKADEHLAGDGPCTICNCFHHIPVRQESKHEMTVHYTREEMVSLFMFAHRLNPLIMICPTPIGSIYFSMN